MEELTKLNEKSLRLLKQIPADKLKFIIKYRKVDRNAKIYVELITKVPYLAAVGIAWILAGKTTIVQGLGDIINSLDLFTKTAYVFGGSGIIFGYIQLKLRKKITRDLSKRITELENLLDSKRTSSNLTSHGETNSEDI